MHYDADVIVVGAGPAGTTAARDLCRRGLSATVVERASLPRYKSCAGGIPVRTARALDFPIDEVVEDTTSGLHLSYLGRRGFTRWADTPIAHMVMRDRFDALLARRACDAGARLIEGVAVRAVQPDGDGFRVMLREGALSCRYVIGADGANSVTARSLGLGRGLAESVALEAEVQAGSEHMARWRGRINLDVGYMPWGYAWVFPKAQLLSIGAVLPKWQGPQIRAVLDGYLERLGMAGAPIAKLVGHKILFRRGHEPIAGNGAALAGDAAGLADEFSEEGIYYAIRSGQLVARHIARAALEDRRWLGAYERSVDRALMPELRAARVIARLFYAAVRRAPWLTFRVSRRMGYIWRSLFRVLRGESGYDTELARWPIVPALAATLFRHSDP
jgi:geranylgeranyl reductase family protein